MQSETSDLQPRICCGTCLDELIKPMTASPDHRWLDACIWLLHFKATAQRKAVESDRRHSMVVNERRGDDKHMEYLVTLKLEDGNILNIILSLTELRMLY